MPDLKHIAQNPALYEQNCIARNYPSLSKLPQQILELRDENRKLNQEAISKRREYRQLQDRIQARRETANHGTDDSNNTSPEQDITSAKALKQELEITESHISANESLILEKALLLPNLSSVHTPNGSTPTTLEQVTNIPPARLARLNKTHIQIGSALSVLDFDASALTSGWGWYMLTGAGALLEQALIQYALSELIKRGWSIVSPPSMVYAHIASACGFQPRDQNDEQQIYRVESPHRSTANHASHVLAGTAEIPLAGMYANQTLTAESLPRKTAAVSRCYRAEVGARGTDTKGLYRVHEFTKVEMFAWTLPNLTDEHFGTAQGAMASQTELVFDEMLAIQRHLLTQLGLNFRMLEMPAADLGASATRKKDIEAFFPSRRQRNDGWGEVTSASICTDYQTRRMRTRLQTKGLNKLAFPYTLNGTAMAIPRILAALLECGWEEEMQGVKVPEVLRPWMHGIDVIKKD